MVKCKIIEWNPIELIKPNYGIDENGIFCGWYFGRMIEHGDGMQYFKLPC